MKLTRWLLVGALSASLLPPAEAGPGVLVDSDGKRYETSGAFAERERGSAPLAGPAVAQLPSGPDRADRRRAVRLLGAGSVLALALVILAAKRFKPRF